MHLRELASKLWPPGLFEIPEPPKRLWIRGAMPPAHTKFLAVVGSRNLSPYGRRACESLVTGLAGYPISIVSGLALGADACAHRAALRARLHTIALPGSGIDDAVIGPRTNLPLAHEILRAGGALISESAPTQSAQKFSFPARNRLMVGISDAVLVIEAGERSGTLISARLAGEYNRELLCVPHRIDDPHGYGAHVFLRLGAALVSKPEHILEALQLDPSTPAERTPIALEGAERTVWEFLESPKTRDEILRTDIDPGSLLTALVSLELKDLIRHSDGYWLRN